MPSMLSAASKHYAHSLSSGTYHPSPVKRDLPTEKPTRNAASVGGLGSPLRPAQPSPAQWAGAGNEPHPGSKAQGAAQHFLVASSSSFCGPKIPSVGREWEDISRLRWELDPMVCVRGISTEPERTLRLPVHQGWEAREQECYLPWRRAASGQGPRRAVLPPYYCQKGAQA